MKAGIRDVRRGSSRSDWNNQWGKSDEQKAWERLAQSNHAIARKWANKNIRIKSTLTIK